MRNLILFSVILLFSHTIHAEQIDLLQLQWSPYGGIETDKDKFPLNADDYAFEKYDMRFQRSYSLRAIYSGMYISAQRNITNTDSDKSDIIVETTAVGFSLSGDNEDNLHTYFIGAIGIGAGRFTFQRSSRKDEEAMLEVNLEAGIAVSKHLLIGTGFTYQHFGRPGDSKAESGSLYLSTGIRF